MFLTYYFVMAMDILVVSLNIKDIEDSLSAFKMYANDGFCTTH